MASAARERCSNWLSTKDLSEFRGPAKKIPSVNTHSFRDREPSAEIGPTYISTNVGNAPRAYLKGGGVIDREKTASLSWKFTHVPRVCRLMSFGKMKPHLDIRRA